MIEKHHMSELSETVRIGQADSVRNVRGALAPDIRTPPRTPSTEMPIRTPGPPPEAAPLQDARTQLLRAASAIRAAAAVAPRLTQRAGDMHAMCMDLADQLLQMEQRQ